MERRAPAGARKMHKVNLVPAILPPVKKGEASASQSCLPLISLITCPNSLG